MTKSTRDDITRDASALKLLFIAGFGPIDRNVAESRRLYGEALGIPFKEEAGGYLHTEAVQGAKSFALWPLSQAALSCFGRESWLDHIPAPQAWLEFEVENVERATSALEARGLTCSSRTRRSPGARSSAASSRRKVCWLA